MRLRRPAEPSHRHAHHLAWRQRLRSPMLIAAALVLPVVVIESSVSVKGWNSAAYTINWIIWGAFAAEFSYLLYLAPDRRAWARAHWYDVALIVLTVPLWPLFLQGLRVLRLLSVIQLVGALDLARVIFRLQGIRFAAIVTFLTVFAGGAAFSVIEDRAHHSESLWNGIWWAIVTITTVGYGDITPSTTAGRMIGIVVMFTGIGFVAVITASLANHFVGRRVAAHLSKHAADMRHILAEHFARHAQTQQAQARQAASEAAGSGDALHPQLASRLDELSRQVSALSAQMAQLQGPQRDEPR